jgi:hypothetical protein
VAQRVVGIIMNGVTGRMGMNQHLIRSILALREQGGLPIGGNGDVIWPEPLLVGRSEAKLAALASAHGTPVSRQVNLVQLGRAHGGTINPGAGIVLAALVFFLVFGLASAAVLFVSRVRRGWDASEPAGAPGVG